jgi:hypothetical protein
MKICNSMPESLSKVCCLTDNEDLKFYYIHGSTEEPSKGKRFQYY